MARSLRKLILEATFRNGRRRVEKRNIDRESYRTAVYFSLIELE